MNEDFNLFFQKHQLNKNARFLLAVSGGVDSVVLADLFKGSGINFGIAHCNFSLRGEEADKDDRLVFEIAKEYSVLFHSKKFDTRSYAEEKKISIQMAARELRYDWFNALLRENNYDFLVTAHHKNDVAETVLFNLIKGTGIKGIRGILPVNSTTIRPLLNFAKDEILGYARSKKLNWREDSSNEETHYHRNYLRKEVIPLFGKVNSSFFNTLETTLEKLKLVETLYEVEIKRLKESMIEELNDGYRIALLDLHKLHPVPLLFELIQDFGFSYDQCQQILSGSRAGRTFEGNEFVLTMDREYLFINLKKAAMASVVIQSIDKEVEWGGIKLLMERSEGGMELVSVSEDSVQLDFDQLRFPLELRHWEAGDFFFPLGMKGKKKISDFMIDHKIPLNLKRRVGILCSGEDIVWVVGYRIDDRYKISQNTKNVLQIAISNGL